MRQSSLRTRLAIRLGLVVFVSYVIFSLSLYAYFERILGEDLDAFLASRAVGVMASIRAYARDFPGRSGGRPGPTAFRDLAKLWTDERAGSGFLLSTGVEIVNYAGGILAATHGFESVLPVSKEALKLAREGKSLFRDVETAEDIGGSTDFRVLSVPLRLDIGFTAVVQVIVSQSRVRSALSTLRLLLMLLAPGFAAIGAGAAALIGGGMVAPLGSMAATLRRITERRLDERVEAPGESRELAELAAAFNMMMDRVEAAFDEQLRFTDDAAHQLRTPLTVLRGELELALKHARSSDEYERVLESNLEEVERMMRLVGRMLDLARLEVGKIEAAAEPVRLDAVLRELADDFEPLAVEQGMSFDLSGLSPARASGDSLRLYQAFMSILENALRYAPPGSAIELTSSESESGSRVSVRDHGRGVSEDELTSIFLRFHRGRNAEGPGHGIGLSLAASVVRLHGGTLVASNRPGGGAVFTASFPPPGKR
ncbi:MAG: ATP-binding protein [Treponema sp.]|nr:ATP-binding protein [Treponema sp.]